MCGLVGMLDRGGHARRFAPQLEAATQAIAHRGPDDDGFYYSGPVGLGFRRLSILDLTSAGHQPMRSADAAWTLVFNGEIYNFIELRRELESAGCTFRSESDTEVLVEAIATWGLRALERCNGMWALLAWHEPSQTLYAARDPWGIKPLYMAKDGPTIVLASEIHALRAFGCPLGQLDEGLASHFIARSDLDVCERTFWGAVTRLKPGRVFAFRDGQLAANWPYADGTDLVDVPWTDGGAQRDGEYIEAFREALMTSIRLRLRSDVPIGTCMSGGLDSTAITCVAANFLSGERSSPCRFAFTALLPEFDEKEYIEATLAQSRAIWRTAVCDDAQLLEHVEHFFRVHAEPVHSLSAFAGFLVMGIAAREGVKVLLNGQGADELLAGYSSTALPYLRTIAHDQGLRSAYIAARHEFGVGSAASGPMLRAMLGVAAQSMPTSVQRAGRSLRVQVASNIPVLNKVPDPQLCASAEAANFLPQNLLDQQTRSPLPLYLRVEDANASAYSLESRLPFLDPALIALARSAPASLLRREGWTKYLLRESLRGVIPERVRARRDKMGFPVPSARWWRGPLAPLVREVMTPERLARRGLYDTQRVMHAFEALMAGGPLPGWLDRTIMFEMWAARQLDGLRS